MNDLTKLSMEDFQLTGQGKLYINQSLCPYCRVLWSESKLLHRMGKIFSYCVFNGTVKIKIQETSQPLSVRYCRRELGLGSSGYSDSASGHYVLKKMLRYSYSLAVLSAAHHIPFVFILKIKCSIGSWIDQLISNSIALKLGR